MDPLDPLTEIVRSGQAFSPFIFIERLIWLLIGFFFIGAMTTGLRNNIEDQSGFSNKSFFILFNKKNDKDNGSEVKDNEENQ